MNILHRKRRRRAEINIVPLVDVLTSLIFFFLLTMQFKEIYAVDITPPSMKSSPTPELIVLGDKESSLQNVMKVVDFARLAKIKKLSLQSLSQ